MKTAIELKTEKTNNLVKRIKFLKDNKPESQEEIEFLQKMINDMDIKNEYYNSTPSIVNFRNTHNDEWYFQQMKNWVERHPTTVGGTTSRSKIYKYALHFFVENIALNPDNAKLTELQLAERINGSKYNESTKNVELKMNQLEEMVSFIMALLFKQFDYVPQNINERGMIDFAINSMNEFGFENNVGASEINPNEQLGKIFKMYKEIRSRDKQLIKKINHRGGIQYD